MTNIKPTLTIGIPAYNEERNIVTLVRSIFAQSTMNTYKIDKIIVVSDGSTDETARLVKTNFGTKVMLIDNKERRGLAQTLNSIIEMSKSDILVTLDADIELVGKQFVQKLIAPILFESADYTTSSIQEKSPRSYFEKCLALSMELKRSIYSNIGDGNNVYTSYGLARGYSRRFYQDLRYPISIGNDMYSYFFALNHKYKFVHAAKAIARYRLPSTAKDSSSQSIRFINAKKQMAEYFDQSLVGDSLKIPLVAYLRSSAFCLQRMVTNPLKVFVYASYLIYGLLLSRYLITEDLWVISTSSKYE